MLEIKDLNVSIDDRQILKGVNLTIKPGEVHAIMGPNGTGKSTLANVIAGKKGYEVSGDVIFKGQSIMEMPIEERARMGLFLGFQYPVEIPGVSIMNFLKAAVNEKRKSQGLDPIKASEFLKIIEEKKNVVEISSNLMKRSVNEGFSGGEKKRNEIFQMAVLEPEMAILDETDSGLDIDALRVVASGVNKLKTPSNATVVITHYQRLLDYIVPDFVHILYDGRIVKSGNKNLAIELEKKGYEWVKKELL